jgi:hypothetical protein
MELLALDVPEIIAGRSAFNKESAISLASFISSEDKPDTEG